MTDLTTLYALAVPLLLVWAGVHGAARAQPRLVRVKRDG